MNDIELTAIGVGALILLSPKILQTAGHTLNTASNVLDTGLNMVDYTLAGPQYPQSFDPSKVNIFDPSTWAVSNPNYWNGFLGF